MTKNKEIKLPKAGKQMKVKVPAPKTKIKIIGIGGGGSSIVSEIAQKVKRASFIVADTDNQALKATTKEAKHFQFGQKLTQGLGTGMDPKLGEKAAQSVKEKVKELFAGQEFCILVSCLGGGVGSGASPVFAEISREFNNIGLGIFTLPFEFEGKKKMEIAKSSLEKMRPNLNAFIVLSNQKIFQIIDKNTPFKKAFSTMNKFLAESLDGLIESIYSSGLINLNFADLKTTLARKGRLAYLNTAETKSAKQIEELIKGVLSNPLYPYSLQGAEEILFNIDGGLNLNIEEIKQIGQTISSSINPKAGVAFGITQNKEKGIKITLLANGCKWSEWEKETAEKKIAIQKEEKKVLVQEKNFRTPALFRRESVSIKNSE